MKLSILSVACLLFAPFAFADDSQAGSGEDLEFVKFFSPSPRQHFNSGDNINFDYRVFSHPDGDGEPISLAISVYDKWIDKTYVITTDAPVNVSSSESYHDYHYLWPIRADYDWSGEFELIITEKYDRARHSGLKTIFFAIFVDNDSDNSNSSDPSNPYDGDHHHYHRHYDDDDDNYHYRYHHHHDDDDYHHDYHDYHDYHGHHDYHDDDDDYHHHHHYDDDDHYNSHDSHPGNYDYNSTDYNSTYSNNASYYNDTSNDYNSTDNNSNYNSTDYNSNYNSTDYNSTDSSPNDDYHNYYQY